MGQLVVRAIGLTGGYFTADDFKFMRLASISDFTPEYLMQFYNGHLMPGVFAYTWVHQSLFHGSYGATIASILVMQLLLSVSVWLLLTRSFGYRTASLVLMAWWCFTVLTLDSSLWWAAAVNQMPLQMFGVLGCLFVARTVRRRSWLSGIVVVACYAAALAFFEKSVLLAPALFAMACAAASVTSMRTLLRDVIRPLLALWLAIAVMTIAYIGYFWLNVPLEDLGHSAADVFRVGFGAYFLAFIPAVFGGPWQWFPIAGLGSAAAPPDWAALLTLNAFVLMVAASVIMRRRALVAWLFLAAWIGLDVIGVSAGRLFSTWTFIGQIYRYTGDVAPLAVMVLGFAFLPMLGERGAYTVRGQAVVAWMASRLSLRGALAFVLINGLILSALFSTRYPLDRWQGNVARGYVTTVAADALKLPPDAEFLPQGTPPEVQEPLFGEFASAEAVLQPIVPSLVWRQATQTPWVVRSDGHLVPGRVSTVVSAAFGPQPNCGWAIPNSGGDIDLLLAPFPWSYHARLSYLASADGTAEVSLGDGTPTTVPIQRGPHEVSLFLVGGGKQLHLSGMSPGLALCVGGAVVGKIEPAPGYELS